MGSTSQPGYVSAITPPIVCSLKIRCYENFLNYLRANRIRSNSPIRMHRFHGSRTHDSRHCKHTRTLSRYCVSITTGGVVALSVEYRTRDQEVVGSRLGRARGVKTLGKFLTPVCLCSPSNTSWYRPKGGDALRLGSKGRYGLCVGGR